MNNIPKTKRGLVQKIKKMRRRDSILIGVAVLLIIVLLVKVTSQQNEIENLAVNTEEETSGVREVSLASVANLSTDTQPLSVIGEVSAASQAEVRAESQGRLTRVNVELGQNVSRGQVIAQIENSREVAALRQAEAALESAQAGVNQSGNINEVSLSSAQKSLEDAIASAQNTLSSAYSTADDAIHNQLDAIFSNGTSSNPQLLFLTAKNQSLEFALESQRPTIEKIIVDWDRSLDSASEASILQDLELAQSNLRQFRDFADTAAEAVNAIVTSESLTQSQVSVWASQVSGARSAINGVLSSVVSAKNAVRGAQNGLEIATENFNQSQTSGATTASASIAQAEAAVQSARVAVAKTTIRAPFSGTITSLPISTGDFVSVFQSVATVANTGSLEITVFLNESDAQSVQIGTQANINGGGTAIVTNISPAVDSATKKVEVILAAENADQLIDGQSARISLERSVDTSTVDKIFVPLSALKVQANGIVVFSLNENSEVVEMPVTEGPLVGDKVLILEGLSLDDEIITDARGIKAGQRVNPNF